MYIFEPEVTYRIYYQENGFTHYTDPIYSYSEAVSLEIALQNAEWADNVELVKITTIREVIKDEPKPEYEICDCGCGAMRKVR